MDLGGCCGGLQPAVDVKHQGVVCAEEKPRLVSSLSLNKNDEGGLVQDYLVTDGNYPLSYSQKDAERSPPQLIAVSEEVCFEEIDRGREIKPEGGQEMVGISDDDDSIADSEVPGIAPDCGSEMTKDSQMASKETGNEGTDIDKERAQRRSGNGEKSFDGSKLLAVLNDIACNRKGRSGGKKAVYTRKEMEVLRYVNVKGQRKMWQKIYCTFSADLRKEYDELGSFRHRGDKCGTSLKNAHQSRVAGNNFQRLLGDLSSHDVHSDMEIPSSADCIHHSSCDGQDGNSAVEEYEDEDSDDDYSSIQRPAFYVEGEPDFESGPPEDGWEYLRRVRWEANHIPKVKVAKLDESKLKTDQSMYMPLIPDIEQCPDLLLPSKQWEDEFLSDFSELRQAVSQVINDIDNGQPVNLCSALKVDSQSQDGPALSSLLKMDSVTRISTLRKRISLVEGKKVISRDECLWLFSLCAIVDTPLDADTCASVRALLRKCAKLRAEKSELDDEVAMLNILVTISGKYFGQYGI